MKRKVSKNLRSVIGGRSFAARCLYLALAVCMAFIILSVTDVEAKSKKKYRLSYTSKTMERGEFYNISLKGVPDCYIRSLGMMITVPSTRNVPSKQS